MSNVLTHLLVPSVSEPPEPGTTAFPRASPSGYVLFQDPQPATLTWEQIHDASDGTFADPSSGNMHVGVRWRNPHSLIYRGFLRCSLVSMEASWTVTSAYLQMTMNGGFPGKNIAITKSAWNSSQLLTSDYDGFDTDLILLADTQSGESLDRFTWILNSSGIAVVQAGMGGTCAFCVREYDQDFLDVQPISNQGTPTYFFNYGGTGSRQPKLTINYLKT